MTILSFAVLNVVYPGLFVVATVFTIYRLKKLFFLYTRTLRILIAEWFKRRLLWYSSCVLTLENLMSLRHISKPTYFLKYNSFLLEEFSKSSGHVATVAGRWLGVRVSFVIAALTFFVYLCPFIQQYYQVWDFAKHIWILGIGLTWSARLTEYLYDWTISLNGLMNNIEACERMLELHLYDDKVRQMID